MCTAWNTSQGFPGHHIPLQEDSPGLVQPRSAPLVSNKESIQHPTTSLSIKQKGHPNPPKTALSGDASLLPDSPTPRLPDSPTPRPADTFASRLREGALRRGEDLLPLRRVLKRGDSAPSIRREGRGLEIQAAPFRTQAKRARHRFQPGDLVQRSCAKAADCSKSWKEGLGAVSGVDGSGAFLRVISLGCPFTCLKELAFN